MSEGIVVPAMNQQRRVPGHLICTMVELNWSLNNIGQTKRELSTGDYAAGKSDKRSYLVWRKTICTWYHILYLSM